ncbi:MAG: membrane protein insertase YidC [candidate division KSB1 bacterium]|nr:membrane protein insertase YidC [candidate division KSB1 bacterium]MDZ7399811.1 membrane protein insertase YidC [candidate division KSB1 bacterium]
MDKRTILAFLLIGLILIFTQTKFYRDLVMPAKVAEKEISPEDSLGTKDDIKPVSNNIQQSRSESEIQSLTLQQEKKTNLIADLFKPAHQELKEDFVVETENYIARINPKGAVIKSWTLKSFSYQDSSKVQLIQKEGYGNLGLFFISNGDTISCDDSIFESDKSEIRFASGALVDSVKFILDIGNQQRLIKTYVFYNDQYIIDLKITFQNITNFLDNQQYYLTWKSGLAYTELDYSGYFDKEDINNSKAYVFQGGSREELSLPNKPFESRSRSDFSGVVDWAAIRTKYFAMIMLPNKDLIVEPTLYGETSPIYTDPKLKDRVNKIYSIFLKCTISGSALINITHQFRVYVGPLDYYIIKKYHPTLGKIMDFGMAIIRPFAKLVLRSFVFLHSFIPNYGIVLIVFSILVKIIVHPLTRKSYVSMQKMQMLQPKLNELKEKYGKDPQRLNRETMKLYKEAGINPLSGCLPTLLQLPLLWAIFIVFRNTIELRDAAFIWWIKDLSAPDTVLKLPFSIPFYGDLLNILPIFMGVTMFIQQKMTMKDPKQKAMVYFMPIFLTLLFNSFPSGLNLYYALFNLFSILQQKYLPPKEIEVAEPSKQTNAKIKSRGLKKR